MNAMKKATITVEGRVQGVFFRDSTMRKARELGLTGTVRNLSDGTVQIIAQGSRQALDALVRWAHEGPPAAAVSRVRVTYGQPEQDLSDGFTISY